MTISSGVLYKIVLMVFFGRKETSQRLFFDSQRFIIQKLDFSIYLFDNLLVIIICPIYAGPVSCPDIFPLTVLQERVYGTKEKTAERCK